jgi:HTH-type transcriptional regulator, sugar sensing transcriptional regulator
MDDANRIKLIEDLGFSKIESRVYYILLKQSPLTGYKIANQIGKSNSNTYLALKNLVKKDAISLLEGNKSKEYVAVPIEKLMEIRINKAKEQKEILGDAFKDFKTESGDDQIYRFKSKEQLWMKANEMIENAKVAILVDSEAPQLEMIKEKLAEAAEKGLNVIVESTGQERIPKCYMVEALSLKNEPINLNFDWLVISADTEKTLVSYFTKQGDLIEGLWISNRLLSDWFYNGMFYEVLNRYVIKLFNSDETKEEILEKINTFHKSYRHSRALI